MEPGLSCPRVTRARRLCLERGIRLDAETSEVGRVSGKALPAHEARRVSTRVREDACIETGRPKRAVVNNPATLPGPNHANGWTDPNGGIPTER